MRRLGSRCDAGWVRFKGQEWARVNVILGSLALTSGRI